MSNSTQNTKGTMKLFLCILAVAAIGLTTSVRAQPTNSTPTGAASPILQALSALPQSPLEQATVILDVGTVSQDALWNNIRLDFQFARNTNNNSAWFLGAEVRDNIATIGYVGGTVGYSLFRGTSPKLQFAPTLAAGWSLFRKSAEVDIMPLYVRYTPPNSPVTIGAGAGYWFSAGGRGVTINTPGSGGPMATASIVLAF